MIEIVSGILKEIAQVNSDEPSSAYIRRYESGGDPLENQFIVFLKPEVTSLRSGVNTQAILNLTFAALDHWQVKIGAIRVVNGGYLSQYRIMDQHYGVINDVSRRGPDALSTTAWDVMRDLFGADLEAGAEIIGGHQFLERFPAFSPFALSTISDNLGASKLAGGTYCIPLKVEGRLFLVLNAFHPFQLEYFTAKEQSIVIFEGRSKTHWSMLRQQLIGATNPAKASEGSIRQLLLHQSKELGLPAINQGVNGIHLSAGPLEGMVELQRFFSEPENNLQLDFQETGFGHLLLMRGAAKDLVRELASNPAIEAEGRKVPAFDFTEELDAVEAAEKLLGLADKSTAHRSE